jgi:thiol-disulfide isomerase/thioredoxin
MDTTVMWVRLGSNQGSLRGKLPQLLKAEIAKAKALGLTPFLVVGATWCGPCQQLEASLHQKDFVDAFSGAYMIHLDMDEWDVKAELTPLGFKNEGIPIIAALDKNSKVISQLEDNEYTAKAIKQYLSANLWESAVHKPAVN